MLRLIPGNRRLFWRNCVVACQILKISSLRSPPPLHEHGLRNLHTSRIRCSLLQLQKVPNLHHIEKVLGDPDLEQTYLQSIKYSRAQHNSVYPIFLNAIDMASGEHARQAYQFAAKLWEVVFLKEFPSVSVQNDLLKAKSKFIHLIINNGDYATYERLVRPIYSFKHLDAKLTWSDTLITTFQLVRSEDKIRYSRQSIITFLKSDHPTEDKKHLLSIFVRKCLLYSDNPNILPGVLRDFIAFLGYVGDSDLHLSSKADLVYETALRLIITPRGDSINNRIETILNVVLETNTEATLSRFLTALLASVATSEPKVAITLWNYKSERLTNKLLEYRDAEDLENVMKAYFSLRAYDKVIGVHSENPSLHSDDQIEILLKISEQARDWNLLQKQFEDMYGQNQLPLVIHYSIVMNALASLGVVKEVEQLYHQLRKRNLQPSAPIYSALIKANSNVGDKSKVYQWYQTFLKDVKEGSLPNSKIAYIQTKLFEAGIVDESMGSVLPMLMRILEEQKKSEKRFVNSDLIFKMLTHATSEFNQKEFQKIFDVSKDYQLTNEPVYCKVITALTKFGEYEKAEEIAFEAHLESKVPFASATITRAQLRNYRVWYKSTTNKDTRKFIAARVSNIIHRIDDNSISPRNMDELLIDVIKHFTALNKLKTAEAYFNRVKYSNALTEDHYLPFLEHYSRLDTYQGYAQVLEKYREMAKLKISISARTYLFLIKALIHMDKINHTGFENSYKLLESVFELYGFSTVENIVTNNVALSDLAKNAPTLLKIISEYSTATTEQADRSIGIVVKFLNQIKEKLGKNINRNLRLSILHETGKIYLARGSFQIAEQLINNALEELHDMSNMDYSKTPPKILQIQYRQLISMLLRALRLTGGDTRVYKQILNNCLERNIRLSGPQFVEISLKLLREQSEQSNLLEVMTVCERYLVSGNWIEIKIRRKIQFIYKLFLLHLERSLSRDTIETKFAVLNRYYNTVSLQKVKHDLKGVRDPYAEITRQVDVFNLIDSSRPWTTEELLANVPEFFVPERYVSIRNIITPTLSSVLFNSVETFCDGDQVKAFELYDQFPETMEYLLYFGEERTRTVNFRKEIDELNPPSDSIRNEDMQSRRIRTIEALDKLRFESQTNTF